MLKIWQGCRILFNQKCCRSFHNFAAVCFKDHLPLGCLRNFISEILYSWKNLVILNITKEFNTMITFINPYTYVFSDIFIVLLHVKRYWYVTLFVAQRIMVVCIECWLMNLIYFPSIRITSDAPLRAFVSQPWGIEKKNYSHSGFFGPLKYVKRLAWFWDGLFDNCFISIELIRLLYMT